MKISIETKELILKGETSFCPWFGDQWSKAYRDLRGVVKTNNPEILDIDGKFFIAKHEEGNPCFMYVYSIDRLQYV